jgi:Raf kinase inhibitor-like YbhB/YbcL family protein
MSGVFRDPETKVEMKKSAVPLAQDVVKAKGDRAINITSDGFANGESIPATYSAYGEDASPPLRFENVPADAKTLAIIMEDPDAAEPKPFIHWIAWNVPAEKSLRTGVPATGKVRELKNTIQGRNSRGNVGYFGPKPPVGDSPHHYHFQVFALDTAIDLAQGSDKQAFLKAIDGHVLAKGEIVGTFQKPTK